MLKSSDLDVAVHEGIISSDQAARLRDLGSRLSSTSDEALVFTQDTRDEPFRLLRGFRDFFIFIGIVIFAIGLTTFVVGYLGGLDTLENYMRDFHPSRMKAVALSFGLLVTGVLLAEWVTRLQRLPLSSLVTSLALAFWSGGFLVVVTATIWPGVFSIANQMKLIVPWLFFLGAVLGMIGFYWRYRLPFTLLPLAASAVGVIFFALNARFENDWSDNHTRILIGVSGLLVFAVAMWFDMKDRLRVTRFSECAFWLHLLAAPMLVHTLLLGGSSDTTNLPLILGTMAFMALVALLIDRRALLVAGLSYLAIAISQIVSRSELLGDQEFAVTASILGACVLCLGLGWTPIRRVVLGILPLEALKSRLPPVAAR